MARPTGVRIRLRGTEERKEGLGTKGPAQKLGAETEVQTLGDQRGLRETGQTREDRALGGLCGRSRTAARDQTRAGQRELQKAEQK